jgi:hypothetical protein
MMAFRRRRNRFLTTAVPIRRPIAYDTSASDQDFCSRNSTVKDPERPRDDERRKASCVWRDRIGPMATTAESSRAVPVVTPTADGVPSPVETELRLSRPWSTSAYESRVSWPSCEHWADMCVSSIHFLPRPGPETSESRSAGDPVTEIGAFRYMLGGKPPEALVVRREAHRLGTVYRLRAQQALWCRRSRGKPASRLPPVRGTIATPSSARSPSTRWPAHHSPFVHSCG